jgi:hypothetical protein
LPTKKPISLFDITVIFPVDDITLAIFNSIKKSNATLSKDELQDAESTIRVLFDMRMYPKNDSGDVILNSLTTNGINIYVEKCEDAGFQLKIFIRVKRERKDFIYKYLIKIAELLKIKVPNNDVKNNAIAPPMDDSL